MRTAKTVAIKHKLLPGNKLLVLVLFVYIFWFLSILLTPPIDKVLPPDPFIFAKNLSLIYWFSFIMLLFVIVYRLLFLEEERKPLLDFLIITGLVLMIYGTTNIIYYLPLYVDTYIHTSASLKILLRGHTPPPVSMMGASTEPGAYLLYSTFMLITSIDSIFFMKFYPVIFSFIMLFTLYVTSKKFTNSKIAMISPMIYVAFHYFIVYVYPGDISQLFFLLFMYLFLLYIETKSMKFVYLLLPIALSGITTYVLFPFVTIPPTIILVLYFSFTHHEKKVYKLLAIAVFIFIIVWILWLTHSSLGALKIISSMVSAISHFFSGTSERVIIELPAKIVSPPSIRLQTLTIKAVITAFEILLGAAVILWSLANIKAKMRQRLLVTAIFFIICILGIAFSALFSSLTTQAYIRFYWFSLMPFSVLMSLYLFNNMEVSRPRFEKFNRAINWTFIIVLMIFLSLSPIIIHDNDPGYYYPSSSLKGAEFAVKNLEGNVIWVKYHVHLIEYMALRNGILFEGYMDIIENKTTRFISLRRYIQLYGNYSNNYDAIIFNDYEDSLDLLAGSLDVMTGNVDTLSGYNSVSKRRLYEQLILQKLNLVYFGGSIRIYAKSE
jgi:hypothetical protein